MKEDHLILLDICFPCLRREPFLLLVTPHSIAACLQTELLGKVVCVIDDGLRTDLNDYLARVSHVYYYLLLTTGHV